MPTTTELTEKYILEHPSIKDCLKNNIINFSKLSRKIALELKIEKKTSMEAILIACRRYSRKLKKEELLENNIINILKNSELEIKNKIVVIIVEKPTYKENIKQIEAKIRKKGELFYAIEGTNCFTLITSEKQVKDINICLKKDIIKTNKDLAMITIKSSKEIENTSGIMSYLFSLFAENGININETMSCWTDTIFIIDEKNIAKTMKFLRF